MSHDTTSDNAAAEQPVRMPTVEDQWSFSGSRSDTRSLI
jgi:hypothetical protein